VYEKALKVLPTQAVVLCRPPNFSRDPQFGINGTMVVHGEQKVILHRPLPGEAVVTGQTRIVSIVDKGPGKGALIFSARDVLVRDTGEPVATLEATSFARGDGGFGGPSGPTPEPHEVPKGKPDLTFDWKTLPQAALIYRLSGDYNPLHADPDTGKKAGFPRPILHGACTFGIAGWAVLKTCCGADPARLRSFQARFTKPVFPGETIRTEIWKQGKVLSFRARLVERPEVVALDNGRAELA
jgi:acyl dehydratase